MHLSATERVNVHEPKAASQLTDDFCCTNFSNLQVLAESSQLRRTWTSGIPERTNTAVRFLKTLHQHVDDFIHCWLFWLCFMHDGPNDWGGCAEGPGGRVLLVDGVEFWIRALWKAVKNCTSASWCLSDVIVSLQFHMHPIYSILGYIWRNCSRAKVTPNSIRWVTTVDRIDC